MNAHRNESKDLRDSAGNHDFNADGADASQASRQQPAPGLGRGYADEHGGYLADPKAEHELTHDLDGEFDFGVEGGQSQSYGPDRVRGTGLPSAAEKEDDPDRPAKSAS